jgi:adenosylcobyric acid synthase
VRGGLLVAGTSSDAGKSVVTAGLCRWLARQGVKVAPFKAQNMSNNSVVARDGAEIGRAQAVQAWAAGIDPEAAMNPVLLKPGSDRSSQVVLMGRAVGEVSAASYRPLRPRLTETVAAAYADLRSRFDVVICEGAGSPTEINLRDGDIANLGLARLLELPVIVVGDIDRGGVFAAMFGTLALLSPQDQALVAGFVINKFRGDPALLEPGLRMLRDLTGRPVHGVLPWLDGMWFDGEDSLSVGAARGSGRPRLGGDQLSVAAVRLPRISNSTDVDALSCEPGLAVRFTTDPAEVAAADLVVLPGSRSTVADLAWLRTQGIAEVLQERADAGRPVLGICGGYQMLATTLYDEVESGAGTVAGLHLLPTTVRFATDKTLGRPVGTAYGETVTTAYEIHHGVVTITGDADAFLDGCRVGAVWGTTWHGSMESDGFRRAFLREVARAAGRDLVTDPDLRVEVVRERRLDALGDLVADHLDTAALRALIASGPPTGLPFIPPGAPS